MNAYSEPRQTKNQRRQEAREKAREMREAQSKQSKRKKVLVQSSVGVVVLAIIGVIAFFITSSMAPAGPGPRNMASDGIKIGQGLVAERTEALQPEQAPTLSTENPAGIAAINIFIDYSCPACAQFEAVHSEQFRSWLESGTVTIEYHPLSFRDPQTAGQRYATRAGNAASCVADLDPDSFFDYSEALLLNQPAPPEQVSLSDDELVALANAAGVGNLDQVESCIRDERFAGWLKSATDRAMKTGPVPVRNSQIPVVRGTPTVLVNGQEYAGASPADLAAFVASVIDADAMD
jgi:protein-disulfide isomerase